MRRPPIACHRAVPPITRTPSDFPWVPEYLVQAAAAKFFPTTCPHQRRHATNVPGPLEARRRAAKRGMALQANLDFAARMPLPLFSFGALFASRRSGEPKWNYEPPSLKTKEPPDLCTCDRDRDRDLHLVHLDTNPPPPNSQSSSPYRPNPPTAHLLGSIDPPIL